MKKKCLFEQHLDCIKNNSNSSYSKIISSSSNPSSYKQINTNKNYYNNSKINLKTSSEINKLEDQYKYNNKSPQSTKNSGINTFGSNNFSIDLLSSHNKKKSTYISDNSSNIADNTFTKRLNNKRISKYAPSSTSYKVIDLNISLNNSYSNNNTYIFNNNSIKANTSFSPIKRNIKSIDIKNKEFGKLSIMSPISKYNFKTNISKNSDYSSKKKSYIPSNKGFDINKLLNNTKTKKVTILHSKQTSVIDKIKKDTIKNSLNKQPFNKNVYINDNSRESNNNTNIRSGSNNKQTKDSIINKSMNKILNQEKEDLNEQSDMYLLTVSSIETKYNKRSMSFNRGIINKKKPSIATTASSQVKSYQAEIDLLFGKGKKNKKQTQDNNQGYIKSETNTSNRNNLLNKISKAINKTYNIFTKINLFEEAETEEFDNPKFRDYMEDRVLIEYNSSKIKENIDKNSDNNSKEVNIEKLKIKSNNKTDNICININDKEITDNFNSDVMSVNCKINSLSITNNEKSDIENLADSLIESSMYGNNNDNKQTFKTKASSKSLSISPNKNKHLVKKSSNINNNISNKSVLNSINNNNNFLAINNILHQGSTNSATSIKLTLFGIFDGHGGFQVSSKAKDLLPKEIHNRINMTTPENVVRSLIIDAFEKTDKELMTKLTECDDMGSTCTLSFIYKSKSNRIIYTANIGDSHAYIVSNKKATRLTTEHKCDNEEEAQRLKDKNALIFQNRMFGQLALTRAFCDRKHKPYGLIATPSVNSIIVKEEMTQNMSTVSNNDYEYDKYLIVASDGIWDIAKDNDLMRIFVKENNGKSTKELTKELITYAIDNGSTDNISLIVVKL